MKGHGVKYAHKREQAITALLSQRSVEEAARATGISVNTLLRWRKQPEFEATLQEARRLAFSQAIGRLQDAAGAAAATVLKIMVDSSSPTGARLRAAWVVLEQAARAGETEAIEARLAKVKQLAGLARKSRKRSADLTCLSVTSLSCPTTTRGQIAAPSLGSTNTAEKVSK